MNMKVMAVIVAVIVVIGVVVPAAYILSQGATKPKNHAPVAKFTVSASRIPHNKTVTFIGTESTDKDKKDQAKLTYAWDFGDGQSGTGVTIIHKFTKDGVFSVSLTVSDGKKTNMTKHSVEAYNVPPSITASSPTGTTASINEGDGILFDVTLADDNLDTLAMKWYFDDVLTAETTSKFNYTPNFTAAGAHTLKAVVTDGKATDNKSWVITVIDVNRIPAIIAVDPISDVSVNEGASQVFKATAMDPDGDNLTYNWKVDGVIKSTGNGTIATYNYLPDFAANGTHTIVVNFTDGKGTAQHSWTVQVPNVNRAPIISAVTPVGDLTINETDELDFNVNATDPDMDIISYNWTLNGVKVASTKLFRYVSNFTSAGDHVLIVKVFDGVLNASHKWNITVLNKNRAPTAVAVVDMEIANILEAVNYNASGSSDPDGDALTYFWEFGDGLNTSGIDVNHAFSGPGEFMANLTVKDPSGATSVAHAWVNITKPIPKLTQLLKFGPGVEQPTPMVVGDVDNDGNMEAVVGASNGTSANVSHGCIYVFDLVTNNTDWVSVDLGIPMAIAVENLDGDPALEIVAGFATGSFGDDQNTTMRGKVLVIDGITHVIEKQTTDLGMIMSIDIADVDGNAQKEVLVTYFYNGTFDLGTFTLASKGGLAVYDNAMNQIYNSTGWGMCMVFAVENMDADAPVEILVQSVKTIAFVGNSDMNITVYEWIGNKAVQKANLTGANAFMVNRWFVSDIDGDTNKEILLGESSSSSGTYDGYLHAFSADLVEKWTTPDIGGVEALYVANIDGTGTPEILVGVAETQDSGTYTGRMLVLDKDGTVLWNTTDIGMVNVIKVGDVDADSKMDIIVGATLDDDSMGIVHSVIHIYSAESQEQIGIVENTHTLDWRNFLILDVDGNGSDDLLFADYDEDAGESYIYGFGFL